MKINDILFNLANVLLPPVCPLCNMLIKEDKKTKICVQCRNGFKPITGMFCHKCGKPLSDGGAHCFQCRNKEYHFEYVRAIGIYEGLLKEAIHKFKYQDKKYLGVPLGKFMVEYMQNMFPWDEISYVVPVPLHTHNKWKRGYNQTVLLGEQIVKEFNKQMIKENLVRHRKTKPQAELVREERLTNLVNAFSVKNTDIFKQKNVLVVDDVCTTGSTIEECAKILKQSGVNKVWGVTLAHGI